MIAIEVRESSEPRLGVEAGVDIIESSAQESDGESEEDSEEREESKDELAKLTEKESWLNSNALSWFLYIMVIEGWEDDGMVKDL